MVTEKKETSKNNRTIKMTCHIADYRIKEVCMWQWGTKWRIARDRKTGSVWNRDCSAHMESEQSKDGIYNRHRKLYKRNAYNTASDNISKKSDSRSSTLNSNKTGKSTRRTHNTFATISIKTDSACYKMHRHNHVISSTIKTPTRVHTMKQTPHNKQINANYREKIILYSKTLGYYAVMSPASTKRRKGSNQNLSVTNFDTFHFPV